MTFFRQALPRLDFHDPFYRSLAALVLPIALQNLINAAVNSADVLMLSMVNQSSLSAVSLANQVHFLLTGFYYGVTSGITMLVSQYWGRGDRKSILTIMGISLRLSVGVTVLVTLLCFFCPAAIMRIFTNDTELIAIGADYLRIIGFSYLLMSISQVYLCVMRSMERARVSTIISSIALLLNIFLNAVFIFGFLGAPKLGVIGVSIATVIARVAELALCIVDAVRYRTLPYSFAGLFRKNRVLFRDFIHYSLPALGNDCSWTIAFASYSVILGHLGSDMVAASSVATTVRDLCTVVCFGISSGGAVLLGKSIGAGEMEEARKNASRICRITLLFGAVTAILILAARPLIFMAIQLTDTAYQYLDVMLWISSYYVIGQAINTTVITGIFRAGGDSRFGFLCDTITMWAISVPLGFLSAFVFCLPPLWVYFICAWMNSGKFRWSINTTRATNG